MLLKNRSFLFIFFCLFFLFSIKGYSENLNLSLQYGIQNTAKAGRSLPLQITVENAEESTFSGNLKIILAESGKHIVEFSFPLVVEGKSVKEIEKSFMLPTGVNQLLLTVENLSSEQIAYRRVGLDISGSDAELLIGSLSQNGDTISFLQNARVNEGLLKTRVISFTGDSFPKEETDLYLLDLLLIRDFDLFNLDKQQRDSLKHYVEHGGVLLFSLSENGMQTLSEDFSSYLETPLDFQERTLFLAKENEGGEEEGESLLASPVYLKGGREGAFSEGKAYLSVYPMGNGLLTVLGYDVLKLERYATEDSDYVGKLFLEIYGQNRLNTLSISASERSLKQYWDLEELMNLSDLSKLPSIPLYFCILLLYLIVVGPGLYSFLRSQNSLRVYRPSIALISLFMVLFIWVLGMGTRINDSFISYVKLLQLTKDSVDEENYINFRSPKERNFSMEIQPEYTVNPILKGVDYTGDLSGLVKDSGVTRTEVLQERDKSAIVIHKGSAFSPHYFLLYKKIPNDIGQIEGNVSYFSGELSGEIINNTNYVLSDAFILLYGRVIKLGKLEKGQSIDVSTAESMPMPVGDFDYLSNALFTGNSKNFIRFILSEQIHSYFPDARFYALAREDGVSFTENGEGDKKIDRKNFEKYGFSIVNASLELSREKDGIIEYSALSRDPSVDSGEFDMATNTMNPMIPLEIRYNLGEEEQITGISFEIMDISGNSLLANFQGDMAIYNNSTGGYDSIGRKEGVLSGDRLKKYLTEKNELKLRFVAKESTASPEIRQLLPMITVSAREGSE